MLKELESFVRVKGRLPTYAKSRRHAGENTLYFWMKRNSREYIESKTASYSGKMRIAKVYEAWKRMMRLMSQVQGV